MEIGEKTVTRFEVPICSRCGAEISNDLCTWGCSFDNDESPLRPVIIRVFERTDVLLEERHPSVLQKG